MSLCRYKNALGIPKKGIHKKRLFSMALNDWMATLVVAFLLTFFFFSPRQPRRFINMFLVILVTLIGIGIILHRMFCVETTIDKWLFG